MKNILLILTLFALFFNDSFCSSDSLFANKTNYKDFEILWNDSLAVVRCLSSNVIDTIYVDYEDHDTTLNSDYSTIIDNTMLSVAGPFVSYEYNYESTEGAYPAYGVQYITYNVETKKELSLSDIFSEEDIFLSLMNDKEIKKYLNGYIPKSLKDYTNHLDGDCEISFNNMLQEFAFVGIKDDSILIEFGLSAGCQIMQGNFSTFLLTLSIPNRFVDIFQRALKEKTLKYYLLKDVNY